jgi:hypothetical protein
LKNNFKLFYQNPKTEGITHKIPSSLHHFFHSSITVECIKKMNSPQSMDKERTNESPNSVQSPFTIKTPQCCGHYLSLLQEGRASHECKEKRVSMYPAKIHNGIMSMVPRCTTTDLDLQDALDSPTKEMYPAKIHNGIMPMVPRCTTTDLDLQDALDSPTKETWLLNHHKLCYLACMCLPSNTRRTGKAELDNKSDFLFVTKYAKGQLPTNMYLVLCDECMHGSTWTSFPANKTEYIQHGTVKWKLAPKAPSMLDGQRIRPIKPAGVPNLKAKAMKTPPSKRLKFNTTSIAINRSPLSNIENLNNLIKRGSLFNTEI